MKLLYYILILLMAFMSSILDTSFFSFLDIYNATILISLAVLISLPILDIRRGTAIFASGLILFFAVFSSLPVWILFLEFVSIPLLIFYLNKKFAFDHSKLLIITSFVVCCFIFQASLAVMSNSFSTEAIISIISFTIINTIAGVSIFYILRFIKRATSPFLDRL